MQLQLYLVLLFYHVVLEELVAIGTGAKPRFCSLIPFFLNSDTRPFSLHLTRNASSSVFAQVMAEAKRLALSPMSSSD